MTTNSKLSNSDSRTIRHARESLALIMDGAIRRLESDYGPNDDSSRVACIDALILHMREEMASWTTTHENLVGEGASDSELTNEQTALIDQTPYELDIPAPSISD